MLITRLKQLLPLLFLLAFSTDSIAKNQEFQGTVDTLCQALFSYLPDGEGKVEFYNLSLGEYQIAQWDMGDSVSYTNPSLLFSHTYSATDLYEVCLTIQDSLACTSTFCLPVFTIGEASICEVNDCVFPGDTDKDGRINIFDGLPIGLGFNLEGISRPNASIEPIFQAAFDWLMSLFGELDSKHADCDGNGIINEEDFLAIDQNYQRVEKNATLTIDQEHPIVSLQFEADTLVMEGVIGNAVTIPALLTVGSEEYPVEDFYGIALSFDYKEDQVQAIETRILPTPLLQENTVFQKNKTAEEQYGLVISNTQQQGKTAHGVLAEVGFVIIEDLIVARTINIDIGINDIKIINSEGKELPLSIPNDSIHLTILPIESRTVITNTNDLLAANISINPNPTTNYLQITLDGAIQNESGQLVIYNNMGEQVMTKQRIVTNTQLNIAHLPRGIYWLEMNFEAGRIGKQIVVSN